ncbi:methyltransferase domain-containing protein [Alphaproteobacteria bacterium]|nr:methyltransferase domain-containing protein [Alphaproteobacteria bacterium]
MKDFDSKFSTGDGITAKNANWSFEGDISKSFSSHVEKSVPFYLQGHDAVLDISDFFVKEDSVCYELGVSTAALLGKLSKRHNENVHWYGIDIHQSMIDQAKIELKDKDLLTKNVKLECGDIGVYDFLNSDFIVSYYTIQFIHPKYRQMIFDKIFSSLNWGGAFILFEKTRAPDARFQDINTAIYNEFKIKNGYSFDEIVAKTRSLKGVLEPFSTNGNLQMLERAGFKDINVIFKWFCFEGFLCIK